MTQIITREPIKVVADVIQHELEMAPGAVMVYNARYEAPTTEGLYIVLSLVGPGKIIGNKNTIVDAAGIELSETQETALMQMIQIDVMSANDEARQRCFEIVQALASTYALQQMDTYQINIASHVAGFADVSEVEGDARINRYTMTIMVNALYTKTKAIDSYGTFNKEVHLNA